MTPERWKQIDEIFHAAMDCAPERRNSFLDKACEGDAELRRQVESLLENESGVTLLEKPALEQSLSFLGATMNEPAAIKQFGSYQVVSMLGKGGMGEVFRAHDPKLGRDVAIKTLPREFAGESEWLGRFRREARMLAALNHPNIASIYGLEESDGVHYLVMELVEGDTLGERIARSGAIPSSEALGICDQVAEALEAAHEKSITHRDIKPGNIKLTPQGRVKVLDFGLAKTTWRTGAGEEHSVTEAGTEAGRIIGTPGYMSPEQIRGKTIDHRTDIWAFGCVLFELLTGKRTFRGATLPDTLSAVLEREPDWDSLPPSTPVKARELLRRCLEKDLDRRVQTTSEIRQAIRELQQSPGRAPLFRTVRSKRLAAAGAGLVLAVAGVALYANYSDGRNEGPAGVVSAVVKPVTSIRGWEMRPGWSPDGTFMAFANNTEGSMDVYVMPVAGGDPVRLTKGAADEMSPRWSPDGKYIAYVADPGTGTNVYLIPPLGGAERKLAETGIPALLRLAEASESLGTTPWSLDGKELLFSKASANGDTAVWRVNVASGEQARVTSPPPGDGDLEASWSFDGSRILFTRSREGRNSLWTVAAGGGEPKLAFGEQPAFWTAWAADSRRVIFTSPRAGPLNLWEVNVDSGRLRQITTGPGWDMYATVSRAGRLAYVSFNHQVDLYAARLDSREDQRLTAHSRESFHPSFSPDGKKLVYQSDRTGNQEIWMLDLETKMERQLTNDPAADLAPDWSPDGREIAFVSTRGGATRVWVMDTEGVSLRRLADAVVPAVGYGWTDAQVLPRWSPDGKSIAFVAIAERGKAVWLANRDGSNAKPVLYGALYFDWYRDSRHILFSKADTSVTEIRALDLQTGAQSLVLAESAIELAVSPDGRTLLYTHSASHFNMNLFTVPLQAGPGGMPRAAGKPRQITNGRADWHVHKGRWSPDGKTIVYTRDADQGDIHTIENYN